MELHEAPAVYEHLIHYDEEKETQVRVTVNTFRGVEYLSLRKYYLDSMKNGYLPEKGLVCQSILTTPENCFVP